MNELIVTAAQELEEELCLDNQRALELLNEFILTLPVVLNEIEISSSRSDISTLKTLIHSLKGTSANLRLKNLSAVAALLESAVQNSEPELFDALILELKREIQKLS